MEIYSGITPAKTEQALPQPHFRVHKRHGKNGQTWTSYFYDMRGTGKPDIALGNDLSRAVLKWQAIQDGEKVCPASKIKRRQPGKRRKLADVWDAYPAWAKRMYLNAERRSEEMGRLFGLTVVEFLAVVQRANGACEVSGIPLDPGPKRSPFSPSIDRIDSAKGYIAGNVRLVCLIVNCAMSNWGEEPLRVLARYLVKP